MRFLHIPILLIALAYSAVLYSQNPIAEREHYDAEASAIIPGTRMLLEGTHSPFPEYVRFQEGQEVPHASFFNWLRETVGHGPEITFKLVDSEKDELGYTHFVYQQYMHGYPVDLSQYRLQVRDGLVVSFSGILAAAEEEPARAAIIGEEKALTQAMRIIGAEKYSWEVAEEEAFLKRHRKDPAATYYPRGELVLAAMETGGEQRLAWKFSISTATDDNDQVIYINAQSGSKLKSYPLNYFCDQATVETTWHGTRFVSTDQDGDDFILHDDCTGSHDWEMRTIRDSDGSDFVSVGNNTWDIAGETGPATTHVYGHATQDYFDDVHGRNSFDNAGGDITFRLRANYANAFYSGSTDGLMVFGMGTGGGDAGFYNTLDVVAHEFTHGVIDFEADLVYQGESGALNESFADILGETCERWYENNQNIDWLHREDYINGENRSFINPNDQGDPDTYMGTNWANTCMGCGDAGGVHTNSGVMNHWFYLLTVGATGTNDNNDDYEVDGIGIAKVRTIAYRNLTVKLGMNSDYAAARMGAIDAAIDLYGACSNEVLQVKNAWYAVGVGEPGTVFYENGNEDPVCHEETFTLTWDDYITNNDANATYSWTVSYNGLGGGGGNGSGASVTETLSNNTGSSQSAVYTVTSSFDGCEGETFTVTQPVLSVPVITCQPDITIDMPAADCDTFVTVQRPAINNDCDTSLSGYRFREVYGFGNPLSAWSAYQSSSQLLLPIGYWEIEWKVIYPNGEMGYCSFYVKITAFPYEICANDLDDDCNGLVDDTDNEGFCCADGLSTDYGYINSVQAFSPAGSFYHQSGDDDGYGDHRAPVRALGGDRFHLFLEGESLLAGWSKYWEVYVDWNGNASFEPWERVVSTYSTNGLYRTIYIPAYVLGERRMRVVMSMWMYAGDPCGDFANGESEDYTIDFNSMAPIGEEDPLSHLDVNEGPSVSATPNPFSDRLQLDFNHFPPGAEINIGIFDTPGRLLYERKLTTDAAVDQFMQIEGDRLPAGLLFLRVESEGFSKTIKLMHEK